MQRPRCMILVSPKSVIEAYNNEPRASNQTVPDITHRYHTLYDIRTLARLSDADTMSVMDNGPTISNKRSSCKVKYLTVKLIAKDKTEVHKVKQ